jgi:putative membrane protein
MMGFGMGFGILFVVLLAIGLIALAVWFASTLFPREAKASAAAEKAQSARQILDQRYARGEVSREEYELMKQDISDRQV